MSARPTPGVRPARPHASFTPEGRRVREVLSYSRRGARLSEREQDAWDRLAERWVVPEERVEDTPWSHWFGREAPLVVEVGSGVGETLAAVAPRHPELDFLAFEVWRPGVAGALWRLEQAGAENVRLVDVDAAWSLMHLFPAGSVAELWTFFPDPWPKNRHHKRRLVQPAFARAVASALAPGGCWRLATDWADYAEQARAVIDAEPSLSGGVTARWAERPMTRFERRGVEEGRAVTDLTYRRAPAASRGH
nr:tRNA (guanosine(46)-N7)-methyltransferase TrmB [Nocardioides mangrovicus]